VCCDPREGPLYRPTLWLDLESSLVGRLTNNFELAAEDLGGPPIPKGRRRRREGDSCPRGGHADRSRYVSAPGKCLRGGNREVGKRRWSAAPTPDTLSGL
jgi:hypothetical protein